MKPAPDIIDAAGELSKFASSTEMIRDLIRSRKKPFRKSQEYFEVHQASPDEF
jgi:hypothetical protein